MSIIDKRVHRFAAFARKQLVMSVGSVGTGVGGNTNFARITPFQGYPAGQPPYAIYGWKVERVEVFCTAKTNTCNMDVVSLLGNVSITGSTAPIAGTLFAAGLAAPTRGFFSLADSLVLRINTDGTGTVTNLMVTVTIRPYPMADEAA